MWNVPAQSGEGVDRPMIEPTCTTSINGIVDCSVSELSTMPALLSRHLRDSLWTCWDGGRDWILTVPGMDPAGYCRVGKLGCFCCWWRGVVVVVWVALGLQHDAVDEVLHLGPLLCTVSCQIQYGLRLLVLSLVWLSWVSAVNISNM